MEMYLQLGAQMMQLSRDLIEEWGGGTVILSPRDLDAKQLVNLANDVNALSGGAVLLDPQFYLPYADHQRLVSHSFWPNDYESGTFWSSEQERVLVTRVSELNSQLKTSSLILPGLFAEHLDDEWITRHANIAAAARDLNSAKAIIATLALGSDLLRSTEEVHDVLEAFGEWDVDGAYLVCEHPNGDYLVKDSTWIANVLDLAAGIRLKKRSVILGYCSHQMLIAALVSADAIASGNWMNVRSFPPEKFRTIYDEEARSPSNWCYAPRVFSEYKVSAMDTAHRLGLLEHMSVPPDLACTHVEAMFSGVQPSAIEFDRATSFKHYLSCLHSQTTQARGISFAQTVKSYEEYLNDAETRLQVLHARRIKGQDRDFKDIVDPQREAISTIEEFRGPTLERAWRAL